ncbi:MAG TPA: DGQHR domain-containing protein [Thermoanaerobaculia bacterium]
MLHNVEPAESLKGLARAKSKENETKTVHPSLVEDLQQEGWVFDKKNRRSIRLRRKKSQSALLEDRVWNLLYKMGFNYLSSGEGALLSSSKGEDDTPIDIVGINEDIALAIQCRSINPEHILELAAELERFSTVRPLFSRLANNQFYPDRKQQAVLAIFTAHGKIPDIYRTKAKDANVVLFDAHDLAYYESLVSHLGPAAKYQFFADMLPGKPISALSLRVPAIKTRMGNSTCYTFSISPEYLLKIAYVSHRSKGKASDVHTYQRMLNRNRLNKIRKYISDDGIFPTNIVVNMESKRIRFERIEQDEQENGVLGWLDIKPAYKSAWIIDGQHRLFAYSGHEKARKSRLAILAFEGLPPSRQAGLFIDINAKQKSVKQSLLQELYAELHWDSEDPEVRVRAIISKAVQTLDSDSDSPLYQRIQTADSAKDALRCITLTSLYGAIEKTEFHIARERKGQVIEFGPLWGGDNYATLERTVHILNAWLKIIRSAVPDWWDKGSGEGGGLAMNDGVTTCINVLRSVFLYLNEKGLNLGELSNEELADQITVYAEALGQYFNSLSEDGRRGFRDLRGIQGQTKRTRRCQQFLREKFPDFSPSGLDQFIAEEKAQTNIRAKEIIDRIETSLQKFIVEELKREYGPNDAEWWTLGVPKSIRLRVTARYEEEDGKRGGKEYYFDLIDYRTISTEKDNWELFEPFLGYGKGSKEKKTSWMAFVNEKRKIVSHPTSAVTISLEDLAMLEEYGTWLANQLSATPEVISEGENDQEE